jgi:hypothetical protein
MRELLRDPDRMSKLVRRRVLRAMVPALGKLDRVARGREHFAHDHERFACVVLARLATVVLGVPEDPEAVDPFSGPEWQTPEKQLQFARLEWRASMTPEERQQQEELRKAKIAEWEKTLPDYFNWPIERVEEWRRIHKPKHISEVEEECYPPHLRMATLKGDDHE